jgi:Glycoside hydrolase 123, catalytic domain/Glycoside hydrolase 123 N-terminal domain
MTRREVGRAVLCLGVAALLCAVGLGDFRGAEAGEAKAATVPADAVEVLNVNSFWRYHLTLKKPMVGDKLMKCGVGAGWTSSSDAVKSEALVGKDWVQTDFNHQSWARSTVRLGLSARLVRWSRFRFCLRGRFQVDNPAAVKALYLTLEYRGGVVVYLNGKEIARQHLPKGDLDVEAPAERYPESVYQVKAGELQQGDSRKPSAALNATRNRQLGPLELPRNLLKKGVNVIAIDLRRAPFQKQCLKWKKYLWHKKIRPWFYHIALKSIKLQVSGGGVRPNVAREPGVQVWAVDRNSRVSGLDYADAVASKGTEPVSIVGARNGMFCGQIAVASDKGLTGVSAKVSDLKGPGGILPASAIDVLYGQTDQRARSGLVWSDALYSKMPAELKISKANRRSKGTSYGAALPVILRVNVPKDAAPGMYKGQATVKAGGRTVVVPIELSVSEWVLPDAKDWKIHTSLYTSPESIAMKYKVEMWSEKHWKLMDKSWQLLGRAGNELVIVPAVDETQFGNPDSMIRYRKKGDKWEYDFSIFDKYMDMAEKYCGKLDHVALQVWHAGGWKARGADNKCTVTVVDDAGKITEHWQVPKFDTEECVAFWKPLFDAVQARLAKRGMPNSMCVGILSDSTAPKGVLDTLDKAFPGGSCKWMRGCHGVTRAKAPYRLSKVKSTVVLHEFCYGAPTLNPDGKFPPVWDYVRRPGAFYFRAGYLHGEHSMTLGNYRTFGEQALASGTRGIGRVCLDYWRVREGRNKTQARDVYGDLYNRYPHSTCSQRRPTITRMSWVGPDGAEPNVRFEAMIESLQDADTVMYLSDAIDNHTAKIGAELEAKCRKLLSRRIWMVRNTWRLMGSSRSGTHLHTSTFNWQQLSKELYDLAAKVKKKRG